MAEIPTNDLQGWDRSNPQTLKREFNGSLGQKVRQSFSPKISSLHQTEIFGDSVKRYSINTFKAGENIEQKVATRLGRTTLGFKESDGPKPTYIQFEQELLSDDLMISVKEGTKAIEYLHSNVLIGDPEVYVCARFKGDNLDRLELQAELLPPTIPHKSPGIDTILGFKDMSDGDLIELITEDSEFRQKVNEGFMYLLQVYRGIDSKILKEHKNLAKALVEADIEGFDSNGETVKKAQTLAKRLVYEITDELTDEQRIQYMQGLTNSGFEEELLRDILHYIKRAEDPLAQLADLDTLQVLILRIAREVEDYSNLEDVSSFQTQFRASNFAEQGYSWKQVDIEGEVGMNEEKQVANGRGSYGDLVTIQDHHFSITKEGEYLKVFCYSLKGKLLWEADVASEIPKEQVLSAMKDPNVDPKQVRELVPMKLRFLP